MQSSSSKVKPKRSDKSPKSKSSSENSAKNSGADSNPGGNTPLSTPAHSPVQVKLEQPTSSLPSGATVVMTTASSMSLTSPMSASQLGLLSPSAIKPSPTLWFTTEIQQMMHGFGDCRKPLAESASLVEEIVHQQMIHLLYQAEEVGRLRNARFLGIEDFLFLMRKDKTKLGRLIRYMTLKDVKTAQLKATGFEEDEATEQTQEIKAPPKKRKKICYDFLSTIDQTGELVALFDDELSDEVKHERALRAEMLSRTLDSQQYLEFCEARQASFTPRYKLQKFKDWLMMGVVLDIKPNPMAMEVLSYLAYEIVAQVVDLALLVRKDHAVRHESPFSLTMPAISINHEDPPSVSGTDSAPTTPNIIASGLKSPMGKINSPSSSPPATPTTPVNLASSGGLNQSSGSHSSLSLSASKSKSKKKKKTGSSWSRDVFTCQAITPSDIREAMRRYGQCVGPFADFAKCPLLNPIHKLLCY